MKPDKAIEEIRDTRKKISAEFGHDVKSILDYFKSLEDNYKDRLRSQAPINNKAKPSQSH